MSEQRGVHGAGGPDIRAKEVEGGRWGFYDEWAAFPFEQSRNEDRHVVGKYMVGLYVDNGGTWGEFAIRFYRWRQHDDLRAARIEAFSDSWRVLADSRLVEALTTREDEVADQATMREVLLGLGIRDRTDEIGAA